jgi:hypothetical protein
VTITACLGQLGAIALVIASWLLAGDVTDITPRADPAPSVFVSEADPLLPCAAWKRAGAL